MQEALATTFTVLGGLVLVLQFKLIRIINIPFYILIGGVCRVHIGLNQHTGPSYTVLAVTVAKSSVSPATSVCCCCNFTLLAKTALFTALSTVTSMPDTGRPLKIVVWVCTWEMV